MWDGLPAPGVRIGQRIPVQPQECREKQFLGVHGGGEPGPVRVDAGPDVAVAPVDWNHPFGYIADTGEAVGGDQERVQPTSASDPAHGPDGGAVQPIKELPRIHVDMLCGGWEGTLEVSADDRVVQERLTAIAFFHAKLLNIHPFLDGNGRLSRLILWWRMVRVRRADRGASTQESLHRGTPGGIVPWESSAARQFPACPERTSLEQARPHSGTISARGSGRVLISRMGTAAGRYPGIGDHACLNASGTRGGAASAATRVRGGRPGR